MDWSWVFVHTTLQLDNEQNNRMYRMDSTQDNSLIFIGLAEGIVEGVYLSAEREARTEGAVKGKNVDMQLGR